jgi:hypothetical protein
MQTLTLRGSEIATAAVTIVKTNRVPADKIFTALSIMAMDLDSVIVTLIEIGVVDGTSLTPIDSTPGSFPPATSLTVYWPCILREGQCVYAKFDTPTAKDRLCVVAHGYTEDVGCHEER